MTFEEFLDALVGTAGPRSEQREDNFYEDIAALSTLFIGGLVKIAARYGKDVNETILVALAANTHATADFDFNCGKKSIRVNTFWGMKQ